MVSSTVRHIQNRALQGYPWLRGSSQVPNVIPLSPYSIFPFSFEKLSSLKFLHGMLLHSYL